MNTLKKIRNGFCRFLDRYIISKPVRLWKWVVGRPMRFIIKAKAAVLAAIYPLLCLAGMEYMNFGKFDKVKSLFKTRQKVIELDLIILYIIFVMLILLVKRIWIACAIMGSVSSALTIASFLKYQNVGEYLYPWDLQQTGNVGTLTEFINTSLYPAHFIIVISLLLITAYIGFSRLSLRIRWNIRIPAAIIATLAIINTCFTPETSHKILTTHSMSLVDGALQTSNYSQNGFVGATTVNIFSDILAEPEGYSEEAIDNILKPYKSKEAGEFFKETRPDVILILQESFWDVLKLNLANPDAVSFSDDPLKNFREICDRENAYSGIFISNAFGGGTVRPEFEVLTGMTSDALPGGCVPYQYLKKNMESYPLMLKKLGYRTIALHPYVPSFYLRNTKYPLIGFDELYFEEDLLRENRSLYEVRGHRVSDRSFVNYMKYFIEQSREDEPVFMFGISMASHQPFDNAFTESELKVKVSSGVLDSKTLHTVQQYTQRDFDADRAILSLVEYVDSREKPTVLVLFGDHAPTLGAGFAAYAETGVMPQDVYLSNQQSRDLYGTPFLIYSNFDLKETEMIEKKDDPGIDKQYIASYNLMNAVMEMIDGPRTPFMEFLKDFHDTVPDYNTRTHVPETPLIKQFFNDHKMITYDRMRGKRYSLKDFDE